MNGNGTAAAGASKAGVLRRLAAYYKPYRRVFWTDMFFAFVSAAAALAIPLVVRYITSAIVDMEMAAAQSMIIRLGVFMAALVLIQWYSNYYISYYGHVMGAKIEYDMRAEIFDHYQRMSFSFYDEQKTGQLMSRVTSDLFEITELLHHGPENIAISFIKIAGAFAILMSVNPYLAVAAFALVPVMLVFAWFCNKRMKRAFKKNREKIAEINGQIEDNLSGIRVVKSFANEEMENAKFQTGNDGFLSAKKNSYFYMGQYHSGLTAFTTLIQVIVIVFGGMLVTKGIVSVTDLVTGGQITVDGKDIRSLQLKSLRDNIGVVQQDVYLFAGSVYDNIAYGRPGASREEVVEAAKNANAHTFIMELPHGYDTDIGQRGIKLSGGQKQRLSIARVFLKNPPILIFDEATSALDNESEKVVQESLEKLAANRTTFVIAHRLSTIRNAEKILVLTEQGIKEQGTHDELLRKNGIYAGLYQMR